ncbi:unnamed protein product [Schistosoma margrebowiei]|uniref:Uncharacterized protein n=1 Tax=Schistosoma margrebowiei TaxID=48269 RepID=A0A183MC85_9TREM|nr:unnamed protein product [Schistosoma margrebowiei]
MLMYIKPVLIKNKNLQRNMQHQMIQSILFIVDILKQDMVQK